MKPLYIHGVSMLSPGTDENDVPMRKLEDFPLGVAHGKVRRCPRYVRLGVAVVSSLLAGCSREMEGIEKERVGTVFLTGYGAVEENIKFTDAAVGMLPEMCSPRVFSYTVYNSCIGQICIAHGLTGYSTMLSSGDGFEAAYLAIASGKADVVICGAVEEYNEALVSCFSQYGSLQDVVCSEGAVAFATGCSRWDGDMARIVALVSAALPRQPYMLRYNSLELREAAEIFGDLCRDAVKEGGMPDAIVMQGNGSYLDEVERNGIYAAGLGGLPVYLPKLQIGETFGASYMMGMAYVVSNIKKYGERVLVLGTDTIGNVFASIVERV